MPKVLKIELGLSENKIYQNKNIAYKHFTIILTAILNWYRYIQNITKWNDLWNNWWT